MNKKWYQKTGFIILFLIFLYPVGLYLMWRYAAWKKVPKIIISIFFVFVFFTSITAPKNTSPVSDTFSDATTNNAPTLAESENEDTTRNGNVIGKSDKNIDALTNLVFAQSFPNDVTGNWRLTTLNEDIDFQDYALSYYQKYFKSSQEVHIIINPMRNTTIVMNDVGSFLDVSVYEHVDNEEQDAKQVPSGSKLAEYYIYTDNGDIEAI